MTHAPERVPERTPDRVLVDRLRAGDERALAAAYDAHAALVHGLALRIVRDRALAADVTQEVFCELWRNPGAVDPARGSVRTWLAVVAHRRAVDLVRAQERRSAREHAVGDPAAHAPAADTEVVGGMSEQWRAERLRSYMARLPDTQRAALQLAYFEGHTYREVATILQIPEGTAKSRLRLALDALRTMITNDDRMAWTP